jgi:3-oxoacyl-[acyl-carrier protein] reductase
MQRVAIVTGGATGIGRTLSEGLASDGYAIVVGYHGNEIGAAETARAIESNGGAVRLVQGDQSELATAEWLVETAVSSFGRLDVLCAHAGITVHERFLDVRPETFDRVVATNLRGTFFTAQAAARRMVDQGDGGRIVLTSSVNARLAIDGFAAYAMTKAGIEALARNLAIELSPRGITVNAVAPGAIVNERNLATDPDYANRWAVVDPVGRAGFGSDVLAAVRYLIAPHAGFVTGQPIVIEGGWTVAARSPDDVERLAERMRQPD